MWSPYLIAHSWKPSVPAFWSATDRLPQPHPIHLKTLTQPCSVAGHSQGGRARNGAEGLTEGPRAQADAERKRPRSEARKRPSLGLLGRVPWRAEGPSCARPAALPLACAGWRSASNQAGGAAWAPPMPPGGVFPLRLASALPAALPTACPGQAAPSPSHATSGRRHRASGS